MMVRRRFAVAGAALAGLATIGLGACGGSDDSASEATSAAGSVAAQAGSAAESAASAATSAADTAMSEATSAAESGMSEATSAADSGAAAAGDPAAGKAVFSANCAACHTLADAGASGQVGPNLDDLKPDAATVANKVTNGGGGMPAFKGQLSDADIANVAAYVSSAAGGG